jgi:tRNA G18 (ribose-2'-O)-methylase SpoU
MQDTRNVTDEFKGMPEADIVAELDARGSRLEIAIENILRDFNMGTIVRSANAFGVRTVHVIGRKQWNKRGAMATDKYLHIVYHASAEDFLQHIKGKILVAVDNVAGSKGLAETDFAPDTVLLFGQEGPGISDALLGHSSQIVCIEQFGSTRSINVGVAAGIVMYEYTRQHSLSRDG